MRVVDGQNVEGDRMTALFLAPHNDDETLFGSFLIQEYRPRVIVCLRRRCRRTATGSRPDARGRDWSGDARAARRGRRGSSGRTLTAQPDWDDIRSHMETVDCSIDFDPVFAPAVEEDGHEHHNRIGELAQEVFGDRVISYLTYTRSHGRSHAGDGGVPEAGVDRAEAPGARLLQVADRGAFVPAVVPGGSAGVRDAVTDIVRELPHEWLGVDDEGVMSYCDILLVERWFEHENYVQYAYLRDGELADLPEHRRELLVKLLTQQIDRATA